MPRPAESEHGGPLAGQRLADVSVQTVLLCGNLNSDFNLKSQAQTQPSKLVDSSMQLSQVAGIPKLPQSIIGNNEPIIITYYRPINNS